jgi:sodium/potassium-transporting ATPase subunit beta
VNFQKKNNSKIISKAFEAANQPDNTVDCRKDLPLDHKPCRVDLNAFSPCSLKSGFQYEQGRPCIFLKLNKIFSWNPQYYQNEEELPAKMPESLKSHIKGRIARRESLEVVWVSCEGENPADIENLGKGVIFKSLSGEQGFLGKYFPFTNQPGYLQPLVAVQFSSVKCK